MIMTVKVWQFGSDGQCESGRGGGEGGVKENINDRECEMQEKFQKSKSNYRYFQELKV